MAARNDVTGDELKSRVPSKKYKDNWDAIFSKKKENEQKQDKKK